MHLPAKTCAAPSSTTIKYVLRTASDAAGNGMGTAIKYLRRTRKCAAGHGLGATVKYLCQTTSAGNYLATTINNCVAPLTAALAPRLTSASSVHAWIPSSLFVLTNRIHTRIPSLLLQRLEIIFLCFFKKHHASLPFPHRRAYV
jgi:hypothetical protein